MLPLLLQIACGPKVKVDTTSPDMLYFILVDRFANGDPDNDILVDTTDLQSFHGGDLEGVRQNLDHIQSLGADAIWLSPIYQMRTTKFHGHGAFHGYWTEDLGTIAPLMGGEEDLETLTEDMSKRNMSLILDVVYNHTSFDAPLRSEQPDWFHPDKTIEDWNDPVQLTTYQVHGLPDLNQSNPEVYNYLLSSSRKWLQMPSVMGLRVDAIRHMDNAFLKQINADLEQDNAWLLGEDFQGNPISNIDRFKQTGIGALFDFPFYYALTNSVCDGQSFEEIASILSLDSYYPEGSHLVRFLDNHDLPRILSRCNNNKASVLLSELLIFGLRGTPMISYGTEHWSAGADEPENRKDMNWDAIDSDHVGYISTLTNFRKQFPVLKEGIPEILHASQDQLVISQSFGKELSMLIVNRSDRSLAIPNDQCRGMHQELLGGISFGVETASIETQEAPSAALLPTLTPLKEVSSVPKELPANSSILLTCSARKQTSNTQTVTINIAGEESKQPRLVGSLPELGGWNPNEGVQSIWAGEHWSIQLTLPEHKVSAFKVVYQTEDGFQWEDGGNRFLHSDSDQPLWIR